MMKRNTSFFPMGQKQKSKKQGSSSGGCFECNNGSGYNNGRNNKRVLISVNVMGSAGALRLVVNEEDLVGSVIDSALKLYAKEGRLPVLGFHPNDFSLYCANAGFDAMSQWDEIGASGVRNFVLCKKPKQQPNMTEARSDLISRKRNGNWKAWLNKSLTFKISSH